ncbi:MULTISPECIES: Stk1 family PASTA domain-containing Ser/Thr kinase [unclassified Mycobacterium]|uniref:Stk1 family PASTA domain-containing Ser/Thr kinase n=1 Tax=unclassified Mycobacterium TaxID=2642494 RepID=UPI0029C68DF5|nr:MULTISPECIES: Stk1 family PASTA domain-containing Ser/Thr kinase [unclassified Mycobacterium]
MTTPQLLSDRYELGEIIGFGGMAEVHLARDLRLHRDVAVKVLRAELARDPNFYQRFKREAKNAAGLNHPAIVAVHDTGEAQTAMGTVPYIVMEYVDGVTLRDIVRTEGPFPPRRAIEIIADACQALHFSHQHGIIHRDVKPANIMISKTGAVKVMDFGIARAVADAGHSLTQTETVIGTAQYLSPEQAHGETVDARSDVYSLGCVLYEILTGDPPFVGDTPLAVAYQHVRKRPTPPSARRPGISPELDAVVLKALAKDPKDRYQTAADMRNDLIRVHSGEPPDAPAVPSDAEPTEPSSQADKHHRTAPLPVLDDDARRPRRRWLAIGALLAVVAVVATIAIVTFGSKVRVPDVNGKSQDEAVQLLQSQGFKTHVEPKANSATDRGDVIDTDPSANASVSEGTDIAVNVSTGPDRAPVPDVTGSSPDEAADRLKEAGFDDVVRIAEASEPDQKDLVTRTVPPANSTQSVATQITMWVGTGPDSTLVPDVAGRPDFDSAKAILEASGFTKLLPVPVDSPEPIGQVVGTNPPAGQTVSVDEPIQVQQSKANQFKMPDVTGQTWDEVRARLAAMGWRRADDGLDRGADVPGDDKQRGRVVSQSPPVDTPVGFDDKITLSFGS